MEDKIDVEGLVVDLSVCDTGMINLPIGYGEVRARIRKAITALTALQTENERLRGEVETLQGAQIVNRNAIRMQRAAREKAEAERDAWKANAEALAESAEDAQSYAKGWADADGGLDVCEIEYRADYDRATTALAAYAKLKGEA